VVVVVISTEVATRTSKRMGLTSGMFTKKEVVYHMLYVVKGVAVYEQNGLTSKKKAKWREKGEANPSEPVEFVACPACRCGSLF